MQNGPKVLGREPRLPRPVIGVCAAWEEAAWSFWRMRAAVVADTYVEALRAAGALPVGLVPQPLESQDAAMLVERIDGLLLVGGADVDPASYGEPLSDRTERTVPERDEFEIALVVAALRRDLPVLGICRGLQILNVAVGGSLHQHLADAGYAEHRPAPGHLDERTAHVVEIVSDSRVAASARALRERVNSHHHQGLARLGRGARVAARSVPDGLVEALEWPEHHYVVGVQWHPEAMELGATIRAFVGAAGRRPVEEAA